MVKAFIVDFQIDDRGRRRISAVIQWGGQESLNPRDVGMKEIVSIVLSPQNITTAQNTQPIAIGSVYMRLGSQSIQGRVSGKIGSTVTLRWTAGSSGTRVAFFHGLGTASSGTKTAHAWIHGL